MAAVESCGTTSPPTILLVQDLTLYDSTRLNAREGRDGLNEQFFLCQGEQALQQWGSTW